MIYFSQVFQKMEMLDILNSLLTITTVKDILKMVVMKEEQIHQMICIRNGITDMLQSN